MIQNNTTNANEYNKLIQHKKYYFKSKGLQIKF